jgi:hypothetical protein
MSKPDRESIQASLTAFDRPSSFVHPQTNISPPKHRFASTHCSLMRLIAFTVGYYQRAPALYSRSQHVQHAQFSQGYYESHSPLRQRAASKHETLISTDRGYIAPNPSDMEQWPLFVPVWFSDRTEFNIGKSAIHARLLHDTFLTMVDEGAFGIGLETTTNVSQHESNS